MMFRSALRGIAVAGALALFALAPGLLVPGSAQAGDELAAAEGEYAIDQFYDELAPYGEWVEHPRYGYVWLPRTIAPDWQPYTVGSWVYTDDHGWYWDSNEPFAWAVYHYGRWGFEADYGWYWVPGDTWAPAWVQWRYGDEYVGWAPEGPAETAGYAYGGPARYVPPPPQEAWTFVQPRYLTEPAVRTYAVPRVNISIVFSRTTFVSRPRYRNGYLYNYGMPRDHWQRVTHRHLEPRRVYRGRYRTRPAVWHRGPHRGVYVYAPRVKKGVHPQRRPTRVVAHKPSRANAKVNARSEKARIERRNRAAGFKPPNPLGPRGLMNPNYRGPGANSAPIGNYKAFEGRKPAQAKSRAAAERKGRPAARKVTKSKEGPPKSSTSKLAKSKLAKSKSESSKVASPAHRKSAAPGNRAMTLAPANAARPGFAGQGRHPLAQPKTGIGPKPSQIRWTPSDLPAAKPQSSKPRASAPKAAAPKATAPKASKSKASKSKPSRASKRKVSPAKAARPAKTKANKPNTAHAKPSFRSAPKPGAKAAKSVKSRSARPVAKSIKGGGKSGKSRKRSADRGKSCKSNPKSCGPRG